MIKYVDDIERWRREADDGDDSGDDGGGIGGGIGVVMVVVVAEVARATTMKMRMKDDGHNNDSKDQLQRLPKPLKQSHPRQQRQILERCWRRKKD